MATRQAGANVVEVVGGGKAYPDSAAEKFFSPQTTKVLAGFGGFALGLIGLHLWRKR